MINYNTIWSLSERMTFCPRCSAEAEWMDADSGLPRVDAEEEFRPPDDVAPGTSVSWEDLIPLVDEADRWKLPDVGDRFEPPAVPDGVTAVRCRWHDIEFDPNEEALPMGELIREALRDG